MAIAALALAGCGSSGSGDPDEGLGALIEAPPLPAPIDVKRATTDAAELLRAARTTHARVGEALGSHRLTTSTTIEVREGDAVLETLEVTTRLAYHSDGSFHAVQENSADYGREVFYTGGYLYLKPRYGTFHRRRPEHDAEPADIRTDLAGELAAQLELMWHGAEVTPRSEVTHEGRAAQVVALSTAAAARKRDPASRPQRAWRDSAVVDSVTGELTLDADTGIPLAGSLSGRVRVTRDSRQLIMSLAVQHEVSGIGEAIAIAPPAPDTWVDTPVNPTEVADRNHLLRGIAPPLRKGPVPRPEPGTSAPSSGTKATPARPEGTER